MHVIMCEIGMKLVERCGLKQEERDKRGESNRGVLHLPVMTENDVCWGDHMRFCSY